MSSQPPSARAQALDLLTEMLGSNRTLDEALSHAPLAGAVADVKFARMLVLTVMRHLGQLDAVIAKHLQKPLPPKRLMVINALRLGAAQLLLLDTPAHAAVNESVALIKRSKKEAALSGLVNAVLLKISRNKPALPDAGANLPAWARTRWTQWYGKEAATAIARIAATRTPLDLATTQTIEGAVRLDAQTLRLPADHAPVETLPGYDEGTFYIQDIAASYPARLLGDVRGKRVLDLCAAPGGKTAQLARAGARVTALDRSAPRMERFHENMQRLRCDLDSVVIADVMEWEPAEPYDAILLDAPCSATGTWRRHPEVLYTVRPEDIAELADLQRAMLPRVWNWLKPGGTLVYCVCSLEREEGEAQAEWFMTQQPDAQLVPVAIDTEIPAIAITAQGYLRTLPCYLAPQGGMDGFFAAAFRKK